MHDWYILTYCWGGWQLGSVQSAGAFIPVDSQEKCKTLLMPSQLNFTIAVCHCVRGYCFELHLSVFHSNSLQNEVSGLCLVSLSAHIGLWSIWGICDRGVIDNHVIPCSNTVRERTIQEQCQKHPKIRFYMQSKHYFTSPTAAKCTKQANLLMKDNIDILHILLHAC